MRVDELIKLLERWAALHGQDAQISVPRYEQNGHFSECGNEIFIHNEPIATILASRGSTVEW